MKIHLKSVCPVMLDYERGHSFSHKSEEAASIPKIDRLVLIPNG